jgi:hypothetical protein
MKNILKPGSIAFSFGLMLTTLGQAQQGAPSGTPLTFKVPPNALSAISFSTTPNVPCSVAPAHGSGSGQAFTVYTNDEGTATFYVTPSQESSSAAQLVATCSSGTQQTIQIQPVAGTKPLVAPAPSNAATNARLGYTVRPALTADPMALSNQELVKLKYPLRPDPQKAPGAYASWLKAVSKPATFIPPKTVKVEGRYHGPAKISADAGTAPSGSPNWSGYAQYAGVNQSPFVWIQGDWNVPALVGGENGTSTYSAFWIGLDGWVTNDVVQDGTEQDAIVYDGFTYVYYYPWAEISPQDQSVMAISNFSVNPGDEIYSQVAMGDSNGNLNPNGGYAYFWIDDVTTGQSTFFSTPFNSGIFSGSSAEWIMARTYSSDRSLYDLSDYWYAVMRDPWAYTYNGNYVNYQVPAFGGVTNQVTMYNGNDILSTVYPIDSNTMEFIWSNYH